MPTCQVHGCQSRGQNGVKMHKFPDPDKDPVQFAKWCVFANGFSVHRKSYKPVICSNHFVPSDYTSYYCEKTQMFITELYAWSVPSIHKASVFKKFVSCDCSLVIKRAILNGKLDERGEAIESLGTSDVTDGNFAGRLRRLDNLINNAETMLASTLIPDYSSTAFEKDPPEHKKRKESDAQVLQDSNDDSVHSVIMVDSSSSDSDSLQVTSHFDRATMCPQHRTELLTGSEQAFAPSEMPATCESETPEKVSLVTPVVEIDITDEATKTELEILEMQDEQAVIEDTRNPLTESVTDPLLLPSPPTELLGSQLGASLLTVSPNSVLEMTMQVPLHLLSKLVCDGEDTCWQCGSSSSHLQALSQIHKKRTCITVCVNNHMYLCSKH